jgi:hypothetical protein
MADLQPLDTRLNGWKEIAAHLGKGVRTVQRWERELGLPVHRMRTGNGEILWATAKEIGEWQRDLEPDAPGESATPGAPPVPRRWTVRVAVCAALCLLVAAIWIWRVGGAWPLPGFAGQPAYLDVESDRVRVFDARDRMVFERHFPELDERPYAGGFPNAPPYWTIQDLDGDGSKEVVFSPQTRSLADLRVFEANGELRFASEFKGRVQFSDDTYGGPFRVTRFLATANDDGSRALWVVSQHHTFYPTVLQKMDAGGRVLGEYWVAGHVAAMAEATLLGRRVILLGGTLNPIGAAVLSVVDYARPAGSSPPIPGAYVCRSCDASAPLAFYVFPRSALLKATRDIGYVNGLRALFDGRVSVVVQVARALVGDREPATAHASYTLLPSGAIETAEFENDYPALFSYHRAAGLIARDLGDEDYEDLDGVMRWSARGLERVPVQKVLELRLPAGSQRGREQ